MKDTYTICCRLPNGFIFSYPSEDLNEQNDTSKQIYLNGANRSFHFEGLKNEDRDLIKLNEVHYGITKVSKELWDKIEAFYPKDFGPFKSGAIFKSKNDKEMQDKINELINGNVKTGFEPTSREADRITAAPRV